MNNVLNYLVYCTRAVYLTPCMSETARQYFSSSLSRSLALIAMSVKKGTISAPVHMERVRNNSENRAAGSTGRADAGKYFRFTTSLPSTSYSM